VNPDDARLIAQIQLTTQGGRKVLCALARRGKALERDEPHRGALLLAAMRSHPLYKGGRLTFDMLEIEDLMLDGPPVGLLSDIQLAQVLTAVAGRGRNLADALLLFGTGEPDVGAPAAVPVGESAFSSASHFEAPAPSVALLPRVRFGPARDVIAIAKGSSAREGGTEAAESWPELLSSDYLYDYVVLGFLDVLGRAIA